MGEGRLARGIIGTWRLVSYTVETPEGATRLPLGRNATGYIIYAPDGYMAVNIMRPERPAYASGEPHRGSAAEEATASAGYLAYAGPYAVDEGAATVRHHMEASLLPNWVGNTQARPARLDGDRLELSAEIRFEGEQDHGVLMRERVRTRG